ncbi:DUF3969 family protein [Deinococcus sp. YIM 134068]|uniref:DUF3969 family protein n=1 Tax=Deinococcus lichenicola TaxID=3118910 RepID=UPI002F9470FA
MTPPSRHSLVFSCQNGDNLERVLPIASLGVVQSLKSGLISTQQAEALLFNPFRNNQLAAHGVSLELLTLLERSFFLDDTRRLGPASFQASVIDVEKRIVQALERLSPLPFAASMHVEPK